MSNKINKALLHETLEKQKQQTLEDIQYNEQTSQPVELDQSRQGRLSRMDALQQQAMSQASLARLKLELRRIDSTLQRLDTEDYGYCIHCGDEIEWERLKLNPSLVVCRQCMAEKR